MIKAHNSNTSFPMVSIIIPAYNVEKYLEECLQSVQNQTLENWEAICINDCSTDASLDILLEYEKSDNRFKVMNNPSNRGVSYARNRGIKHASGKYVYFLDADDMIVPEAMEELEGVAEKDQLEGVFFDTKPVFETEKIYQLYGGAPYYKRDHSYEEIMTGQEFFWKTASQSDYSPAVWMQFWLKDFLVQNDLFFSESIPSGEDMLFTLQTHVLAKRVKHIPKAYHIYRRREGSITADVKNFKRDFYAGIIMFCEGLCFFQKHGKDIDPKFKGLYLKSQLNEWYQFLNDRYNMLSTSTKMTFDNLMCDILYHVFCNERKAFQQFLHLLQKGTYICYCDKVWENLLLEKYQLVLSGLINIEPEVHHLDLNVIFLEASRNRLQIYFTDYYDQVKKILVQEGYAENRDFMDGRILLGKQ